MECSLGKGLLKVCLGAAGIDASEAPPGALMVTEPPVSPSTEAAPQDLVPNAQQPAVDAAEPVPVVATVAPQAVSTNPQVMQSIASIVAASLWHQVSPCWFVKALASEQMTSPSSPHSLDCVAAAFQITFCKSDAR